MITRKYTNEWQEHLQTSIPERKVQFKLTEREYEVLQLAAKGHTNAEAAEVLFVSKRTVDFHLAQIYFKLGVKNRVSALNAAQKAGILRQFD